MRGKRILAVTLASAMVLGGSFAALAAEPGEDYGIRTLDEVHGYEPYTKDYDYGTLNFTHSEDGYSASEILSVAVEYIVANEGEYTTVLKSDSNKGTSIGKIGWHAENALLLLQLIVSEDSWEAYEILGDDLYYEITTSPTSAWADDTTTGTYRILTDSEAEVIGTLLGTEQSIRVQDKLAESYVISYLNNGWALGLRRGAVLVDYADMENQYGYYQTIIDGVMVYGSHQCVEFAINLAGSAEDVTLNEMHMAGVLYLVTNDIYTARGNSVMSAYIERRRIVYGKLVSAGWPYGDSVIPYSYTGTEGAAWLKENLNVYMDAGLTVNSDYDDDLIAAVMNYQRAVGYDQTGYADLATSTKLIYDCYYAKATGQSTEESTAATNIVKIDGIWTYTVDDVPDYSYTGLAKNANGWWYVENGVVNFDYTGFARNEYGKWYVENSKVTFAKNSVLKDETGAIGEPGVWYYVVGSQVQTDFTGLADYRNANGWWYIRDGAVDFTVNTVAKNKNGWWYVEGGKVIFSYNGFGENEYGFWYLEDGKVTFSKNSVLKDETGAIGEPGIWYYVVGSQVQTDFTGLADYRNGNGWWYITDGMVDFTVNTVAKNKNGWWYVEGGKVIFSYNGFATNCSGKWYVENGEVDFTITSVIKDSAGAIGEPGTWYYVVGNRVKTDFTGLANHRNAYGWWYIRDGAVDFTYTGVAENRNGWWYVSNGKVDFSFSGTVAFDGILYTVEDGAVVSAEAIVE